MKLAAILAMLIISACSGGPRRVISSADAPAAIGPYSQAIEVGGTVYIAGQIALDPKTGQLVEGDIEAQTHRVMQNLSAVLAAAGLTFDDVVQTQAYLEDLEDYGKFNQVYAEYMRNSRPARAVVGVARIPRDALVEVMMTAVR